MKPLGVMLTAFIFVLSVSSLSAHKTSTTFGIQNQQSEAVSNITVSTASDSYSTSVSGFSSTSVEISSQASSVTINSQVVPQGTKALVTLASGKVVGLMWISTTSIVIVDRGELE